MSSTSQVVWKYPLALTADVQLVEVPVTAKLVRFAMQGDVPTMWLLVEQGCDCDQHKGTTVRGYFIRGTGDPAAAEPDALYRGTADHRGYVWHLFELLRSPEAATPDLSILIRERT